MANNGILLYASGSGLIVDYIELCARNLIEIKGIVRNRPNLTDYSKRDDLACEISDIGKFIDVPFVCPLFTPQNRMIAVKEAEKLGLKPYTILSHQENHLSLDFSHGVGCFINKRVVIGASTVIGNHVVINRGACLGHDLTLSDYVSIGPGVITGGNIHIGKGTLVGTGAVIKPGISIGEHAIIGAGAVVIKNVEDYAVVVGNPGTTIKKTNLQSSKDR